MKYLNRQKLGIEAFLASRSNVLSRHNELDPDEFINRLRVQPYAVRLRVANDVREAIAELSGGKYDTASLIPPHIIALSEGQCSPDRVGKMRPFFSWLQSLWRDNDQARSEWISQLKTVARNLNAVSGDCLMAVSTGYNNQRGLLERREDGSVELSMHERRWGRLSINFPNCEIIEGQSLPILGFVYIIEGEALEDGRFRFEILFDTEFFPANDFVRALKPTAWRHASFICDAPGAQLAAVNYALAAEIRGASRLESVRYSSEILCEKASLAGEAMLSAAERSALNVAKLLYATKLLAEKGKKGDARLDDILLDLADNRYAFEKITELFRKEKAEPIAKLLEKSVQYLDSDDVDRALNTMTKIAPVMDSLCAEGELVPLLEKLHSMMLAAGECEESGDTREAVFRKAAAAFADALEPQLRKMGFEGKYPHYRRIRHGRAEYISAVTEREGEALEDGRLHFSFIIAAAQTRMKRSERKAGVLRGIDFDKTYGTDLFNERPEYSKSGLVDCADSQPFADVSVDIITGQTSEPDSVLIGKMLRCAKRAMNGFSLRRRERAVRRQRIDRKTRRKEALSSFFSAFTRFAPSSTVMCAVAAGLYLWGRTQSDFIAQIDVRTAVFPIALAGIVTALLRALFYCLGRRNKLWTY